MVSSTATAVSSGTRANVPVLRVTVVSLIVPVAVPSAMLAFGDGLERSTKKVSSLSWTKSAQMVMLIVPEVCPAGIVSVPLRER